MTDEQVNVAIVAFFRFLGALAITTLFVLCLIVSSAQSGASRWLALQPTVVAYSVGQTQFSQIELVERRLRDLHDMRNALVDYREKLIDERADAIYDSIGPSAEMNELYDQMRQLPDCGFMREKPGQIHAAIMLMRQCQDALDPLVPQKDQATNFFARAELLIKNGAEADRLARRIDWTAKQLARIEATIRGRDKRLENLLPLRAGFSELASVRERWMVNKIADLPPSAVQMLLALSSGMFGSLLLTLVLIVYPKNDFSFTEIKGGLGARIGLGGLIAMCVFVVLGGGSAVLGASTAFSDGTANFYAFCAVGILAGMFSDRVAKWLSDRANIFFQHESKSGTPTPAAPASGSGGTTP